MKSKRLYLLTIFYIVILAIIFTRLYPEVSVTAVTTVIALSGIVLAVVTNIMIHFIRQKRGKEDGK
ncbi:hypothetical protein [Kaarinaea lacus]